jgi:membrane-bound metal-dependent hydrolase YbcI (DUF457 family)
MSWAAHDLEPYAIQRHLGGKVAFIPLLLGSYSPDVATKWFVYGISVFGVDVGADDPAEFHRGWPGVGFMHSLFFGVAVALVLLLVFHSRIWAFSFLLGQWAHSLTDTGDTVGTMLFFPFSQEKIDLDLWAYAGQTDRLTDAAAYHSGLGFVWDGVWVLYGLVAWRVFTRTYFRETIVPADPFWRWAGRWLPEIALVTLYRASYFYGTTRWAAWLIWAHVVHDYPFDLTLGGPHWVPAVDRSD